MQTAGFIHWRQFCTTQMHFVLSEARLGVSWKWWWLVLVLVTCMYVVSTNVVESRISFVLLFAKFGGWLCFWSMFMIVMGQEESLVGHPDQCSASAPNDSLHFLSAWGLLYISKHLPQKHYHLWANLKMDSCLNVLQAASCQLHLNSRPAVSEHVKVITDETNLQDSFPDDDCCIHWRRWLKVISHSVREIFRMVWKAEYFFLNCWRLVSVHRVVFAFWKETFWWCRWSLSTQLWVILQQQGSSDKRSWSRRSLQIDMKTSYWQMPECVNTGLVL